MATAQHLFLIVFDTIDLASKDMKALENRLNQIGKRLEGINKGMSSSFSPTALGLTFFGMFMMRTFQGIFRELFNAMQKFEGYNTGFIKATGHLQASWEFLKFAIVNTLNNPMFIEFIMNIVTAVDATSEWVQKNEETVNALIKISAELLVIGGLIMVGASIYNGFISMRSLVNETWTILKGIGLTLRDMAGLAQVINLVFAIGDTEVTVKDLIFDFIFGVLALVIGMNPILVGGLMAMTLLIRFRVDPEGTMESLGKLWGYFVIFSLELANIINEQIISAVDRLMARVKALYYIWKATFELASGNFSDAKNTFGNFSDQIKLATGLDKILKKQKEVSLFSGDDMFTKGVAEVLVPYYEQKGMTDNINYVNLKNQLLTEQDINNIIEKRLELRRLENEQISQSTQMSRNIPNYSQESYSFSPYTG